MEEETYFETNADLQADTVEAAFAFAMSSHCGQKDKSGKAYILHPLRTALSLYPNERAMMTAALHDVIEDCKATKEDLLEAGFGQDVVDAVVLLSRPGKNTPNRPTHREYVQSIIDSHNDLAITVKIADTYDNVSRVNELPEEQQSIKKRYEDTLKMFADAGY